MCLQDPNSSRFKPASYGQVESGELPVELPGDVFCLQLMCFPSRVTATHSSAVHGTKR